MVRSLQSTPSKSEVYTFDVTKLVGFEKLWQAVVSSSTIPEQFDYQEFRAHIAQPHLRELSSAIDHPPTPDVMNLERDTALLDLRNRSYPEPRQPFLHAGSGVVNLTLLMDTTEGHRFLDGFVSEVFHCPVSARGHFLYPPGGFRDWHTNIQNEEGWIMYVIRVDRDRKSFFRYIDPRTGEMRTLWDFDGVVNVFHISKTVLFWHCIKSLEAFRWSRGFLIPDNWSDYIRLR